MPKHDPSTVSEKISKTTAARKGGRPRLFPESREFCQSFGIFGDAKTERHRLNIVYRQRALSILMTDPAFEWLCSTREAIDAGVGRLRFTILSELGRIDDEESLRRVATIICERKAANLRCREGDPQGSHWPRRRSQLSRPY
jgi:hypothetical protein